MLELTSFTQEFKLYVLHARCGLAAALAKCNASVQQLDYVAVSWNRKQLILENDGLNGAAMERQAPTTALRLRQFQGELALPTGHDAEHHVQQRQPLLLQSIP